jgi:gas vesicle protein
MSDYEFDDDAPYVVIERTSGSPGSFLIGAALGVGLALLFAPRSGAETRREISESARRVRARAQDIAGEIGDTVTDSFNEARQEVEDRIETARNAIETKRTQVSRAVDAGRAAARQTREDLERRIAETKEAYEAGADVARVRQGRRAARNIAEDGIQ